MESQFVEPGPHVQAFVEQLLTASGVLVSILENLTDGLAANGSTREEATVDIIEMLLGTVTVRLASVPPADFLRAAELIEQAVDAVFADLRKAERLARQRQRGAGYAGRQAARSSTPRLSPRAASAKMSGVTAEAPSFSPELFAFLRDLAANNDREWFTANKARYVAEVQEPALAFVEDVGVRLPELSRHFVADARTTGGSLFRIHRDVRFSKDKSPYKTNIGIQFRHARSRDVHAPGFYLNLEPDRVFMACGSWRPDRDTLHAFRTAIAAKPGRWRASSKSHRSPTTSPSAASP